MAGSAKAGLQVGDRIVKVDGQPLTRWSLFASTVRDKPDADIALDIERNGETHSLILTPDSKTTGGRVEGFAGVVPKSSRCPKSTGRCGNTGRSVRFIKLRIKPGN